MTKEVNKEKVRAGNAEAAAGTVRNLKRINPEKGERFLDIGANICFVANWAASCGCDVLAYEPMPITNEISRPADGVRLVQKAVTADGREIAMQVSKEALERGYLCSAHVQRRESSRYVSVKGIQSDKISDVLATFKPNITKIDIEGGEYEILPVADLSNNRALFVEFHGCGAEVNSVLLPMIIKRLFLQGFTPTHGWSANPRFDPRTEFTTLLGFGFWREIIFERTGQQPRGLDELMDGVKRILASGKFRGPRGRCSQEAFDAMVKETT